MDGSEIRLSNHNGFYPPIEPYAHGFLPVAGGHSIYWEECGNPDGIPVFIVHGGPGCGCGEKDRRLLDPEKWRIILFDQRGSHRSVPFGSIENNTTEDLARDMWNLRRELGIKQTVLFGGSWGSTLALYYAIRFPEDVLAIILRGIFLGEKAELDILYNGGTGLFFPEEWERFIGNVPPEKRNNILGYFYERMTTGTQEERRQFAFELSRFEENLLRLEPLSEEEVDAETKDYPFESIGLMEAHYFVNNCFMKDGFILKNTDRIPKIPISINQGRWDMVCPPDAAWRLKKSLEATGHQVDYNILQSGHAKTDPEMLKKLVEEGNRIHSLLAQTL